MSVGFKLSKETQDKMSKGLSSRERGRLMWERLEEIYNNGQLQYLKNRNEVAAAVGFTKDQKKRGYGWVTNMINRKHLDEVSMGINANGKMEYQYFLCSNRPNYKRGRSSNARKVKSEELRERMAEAQPLTIVPAESDVKTTTNDNIRLTIERGDVKITIENFDTDFATKLVLNMLKETKEE